MKCVFMYGPEDGKIMDIPKEWLPTVRIPMFLRITAMVDPSEIYPTELSNYTTYTANGLNAEGILQLWWEEK